MTDEERALNGMNERFVIHIPECCREGDDDCLHTAKLERPKKTNVGL